jgi:hypothetical protein
MGCVTARRVRLAVLAPTGTRGGDNANPSHLGVNGQGLGLSLSQRVDGPGGRRRLFHVRPTAVRMRSPPSVYRQATAFDTARNSVSQ